MDTLKSFPKEDQEKRQLEEIAHLYFSKPRTASKRHDTSERHPPARVTEPFRILPEVLFVRCSSTGSAEHILAWFLFNLAVMLRIVGGPVLVIGSERTYARRFSFGFRPDRERLHLLGGGTALSTCLGPMGLCLLSPGGAGGPAGSRPEHRGFGLHGGRSTPAPFQYVLSDVPGSSLRVGALGRAEVFLVAPDTWTSHLLGDRGEKGQDRFRGGDYVGILVSGAEDDEEAEAIYLHWRKVILDRWGEDVSVDHLGRIPPCLERGDPRGLSMDVLERPEGPGCRFCRAVAFRIQRRRLELVSGVPG